MTPAHHTSRPLDFGGDVRIEVPCADGARPFAVATQVCASPTCPVLHLFVRAATEPPKPNLFDDDVLWLDLNVSKGRFADVDGSESPFAPDVTTAIVDALLGAHLEPLVERWRRIRATHAPGRCPERWAPGELAAYTDVFPLGWDLTCTVDGRPYVAVDHYCVTPWCPCTELTVQFVDLAAPSAEPTIVRATLPATRDGVSGEVVGVALWQALLDALPAGELSARFRRVRGFANSRAFRAELEQRFSIVPARPQGDRSVHHVRAFLMDTEPPVWRRIEVDSATTLDELERVVRRALGRPEEPSKLSMLVELEGCPMDLEREVPLTDRSAKLADFAPSPGGRLRSSAGRERGWDVDVLVEAIDRRAPSSERPRVVDGEGALPPAACVDADSFYELFDALLDPSHRTHARAAELLGADYRLDDADDERWGERTLEVEDEPQGPDDVVRVLDGTGRVLMSRTLRTIRALGDDAGPALMQVLGRPTALVGGGAKPTAAMHHAVRALGVIAYAPAVGRLLELLRSCAPASPFAFELSSALAEIGAPAVEPLFEAYDQPTTSRGLRERLRQTLTMLAELEPDLEAPIRARLEAKRKESATARARTGRNDPCWCGSGKKYKKCHLAADEKLN